MGLAFDELSGRVIAAAIAVHKGLGPGFMESVYEQAFKLELSDRGIPFESQKVVEVCYGGRLVGAHVLDLLVAGSLVVELKAVKGLEDIHYAQVKSYLRASGTNLGLLLNFNSATLDVKRVVLRFENRIAVPVGFET